MYIKTLTVSAVNGYIKKVLDNDFILKNIHIKGEISNLKIHSSGNIYFSLKDDDSKISCIMFKNSTETLDFIPEDGMKVVISGRVSVYNKSGSYQIYCNKIELDGLGELYVAFNKLKEKLERDGLFDYQYKKNLPKFPKKIGVITSPTGAAIKDIINVAKRRNKSIEILIFPSLVQGLEASKGLIDGIDYFNTREDIDIIILARGGGSIEELWAFNDEELAYSVFKSKIPIITGVGHETDFTIVDFVSDKRAPTPSAASEIAIPELKEINNKIKDFKNKLDFNITSNFKFLRSELENIQNRLKISSPKNYIKTQYSYIDKLTNSLKYNINHKISYEKQKLSKLNAILSSNNPLNILDKGYSLVKQNDKIIKEAKSLENKHFEIKMKDGIVKVDPKSMEVL